MRSLFPIFAAHPDLVYLDNAATTQKPQYVLERMAAFYNSGNAAIHRGLYPIAARATAAYEEARKTVATFMGSSDPRSIAFTSGTTESINLVANSFRKLVSAGDNIVISAMEHHANLIPWQVLCHEKGAQLKVLAVDANGSLALDRLKSLLDHKTKLLAITAVSNVLGTINPIEEITGIAHARNVPVLVDAAQAVPCLTPDVASWKADFVAFSAHKMFGPLGTGVLYVQKDWQPKMIPMTFGGGAIRTVSFESTEWLDYPFLLEPGTRNAAGVEGLVAAIAFMNNEDVDLYAAHTRQLAQACRDRLSQLSFVQLAGNPGAGTIVAFTVRGIHAHDAASFLGSKSVAVRAGHHCAEPLHKSLGLEATVRASFSWYNTASDIDRLVDALVALEKFWQ